MKVLTIICLLLVFCIMAFYANTQGKENSSLTPVWTENKVPGKDMKAPESFKITPYQACAIVIKSGRLSPKHPMHLYTDGKMYYVYDNFFLTSSPENAQKHGVKVDGTTGDILN